MANREEGLTFAVHDGYQVPIITVRLYLPRLPMFNRGRIRRLLADRNGKSMIRCNPKWLIILTGIVGGCLLNTVGCTVPARLRSPDRLNAGYTVVLPGIEGKSPFNANICKGLADGGIPSALEVYDWTAGSYANVLLVPVNLRMLERNKAEARKIARKIMDYQDQHPGRPVHLIGHSGGGGVAVLTLEALPPSRQITSAILLAPAIAPDYDLRQALARTRYGIWNFYSPYDRGFLQVGTFVMGTIDGEHTAAAGAVGFTQPWGLDSEDRQLYSKLHQQRYTSKMAASGHNGNHFGWANRQFVAEWLAPVLYSQMNNQAHYAADTLASTPRPSSSTPQPGSSASTVR